MDKKYLLEIGYALRWPSWGENEFRMFRSIVLVEQVINTPVIHSYKFVSLCYQVVDLTNRIFIKDCEEVDRQEPLDGNTFFSYKMVPLSDVVENIKVWEKENEFDK